MKRFVSLLIIIALIACSLTIYADESNYLTVDNFHYDAASFTLKLSGVSDISWLPISVWVSSEENVSGVFDPATLLLAKSEQTGVDGTFSFEYSIPHDLTEGEYYIYLQGYNVSGRFDDSFAYRNVSSLINIYNQLIGVTITADNIESSISLLGAPSSLVDTYHQLYEGNRTKRVTDLLSDSDFDPLPSNASEEQLAEKLNDLFDCVQEGVVAEEISTADNTNIKDLLKKYGNLIGIDASKQDLLSDSAAPVFYNAVVNADYANYSDIKNVYNPNMTLCRVNYGSWERLYDIVEDEGIEYDKDSYEDLKSSNKDALWQGCAAQEFTDVDDIAEYLDDEISSLLSSQKNNNNGNNGPGGTGGGGGAGGGGIGAGLSNYPATAPVDSNAYNSNTLFNDIDGVAWAKDAIIALTNQGIISGVGDNMFAPSASITRAEFAKLIAKGFQTPRATGAVVFDDVTVNDWYYDSVMSLYSIDVLNGVDDKNFEPNRPISRQEIATVFLRILEYKRLPYDQNENTEFADDNEIANWAKNAVAVMRKNEFINGVGDNKFAPLQNATRAEAAVMLYRIMSAYTLI